MKNWLRGSIVPVLGMLVATSSMHAGAAPGGREGRGAVQSPDVTTDELRSMGREAYLFAYPLVLMDVTRKQMTHVPNATTTPGRAPANRFAHLREFPPASFHEVVRPNFDTLYSSAWLDLRKEPIILSVPDTDGRYYLMEMLDAWTDVFASPGARTTGTKARSFALVSPDWKGKVPAGVDIVTAPTPMMWIIGRTQTNGPADYANVRALQDQYKLTPLSQWGAPAVALGDEPLEPNVDARTAPAVQVERMDMDDFFAAFSSLVAVQKPHANDYPMMHRLSRAGFVAGKGFEKLSAEQRKVLREGAEEGRKDLFAQKSLGISVNGWTMPTELMGTYGTSYRRRAVVALLGLGANLPEDAVYPLTYVDSNGRSLTGQHGYTLHFAKDALPPAEAFWSVTLYDNAGFAVPNPLNRFALGDRDALRYNPDGSLDLYVQAASPPEAKKANWLPAPQGEFSLTMRLYSPKRQVLDGTWKPPMVRRNER